MNTVRDLFPHPHTFFPSHSRQTGSTRKPYHHVPGWYYHPESAPLPIKLSSEDVSSSRRRRQQRKSYEYSHSLPARKGEKTRSRRRGEVEFSRHGRAEAFSKQYGDGSGMFATPANGRKSIENMEREREVEMEMEMEIQRRIDGITELQDAICREQERIEDEWKFLERAWEVLGESRDAQRWRERDFKEWMLAERSLSGGSGRVGSDRSGQNGRQYRWWNEGRWEDTEAGSPDTRGLY